MSSAKIVFYLSVGIMVLMVTAGIAQDKSVQSSVEYTLDNCVNEFSMDDTVRTKVGYQYWFADKQLADGKTLKMSVVAPGKATHAPHNHKEDEFFFVLEGKAEFYLNGEKKVVGPYSSFYCPCSSNHGIRNAGDTELKYLVIKKYEK